MNTSHEASEAPRLLIVRKFDVAPEIVFDAFTKLEAMRVWWTDDTTFDIDLRVGGRWTIIRREENDSYTATGEYLEVEHPHQLKYTYAMPQFPPNSDIISINILQRMAKPAAPSLSWKPEKISPVNSRYYRQALFLKARKAGNKASIS